MGFIIVFDGRIIVNPCLIYNHLKKNILCRVILLCYVYGIGTPTSLQMSHTHARTPTQTHTQARARLIVSADPLLCLCDNCDHSYSTDEMEKAKTKKQNYYSNNYLSVVVRVKTHCTWRIYSSPRKLHTRRWRRWR